MLMVGPWLTISKYKEAQQLCLLSCARQHAKLMDTRLLELSIQENVVSIGLIDPFCRQTSNNF